jgi:hypothetical protein
VSFGQREATRRGQTRWHAVSLGPGKRFMQEFHRVVRGAAEGWNAQRATPIRLLRRGVHRSQG